MVKKIIFLIVLWVSFVICGCTTDKDKASINKDTPVVTENNSKQDLENKLNDEKAFQEKKDRYASMLDVTKTEWQGGERDGFRLGLDGNLKNMYKTADGHVKALACVMKDGVDWITLILVEYDVYNDRFRQLEADYIYSDRTTHRTDFDRNWVWGGDLWYFDYLKQHYNEIEDMSNMPKLSNDKWQYR